MKMVDMKENPPLFSVIVPAYNSGKFINKCVESVLKQTCPDFELILVDDGSADNTLELCRGYESCDARVKVLHKENGGHTSARNAGLQMACGQYVLFLDSDDWLSLETLACCKAEIASGDPDVIVFGLQNSNADTAFPVLIADGRYDLCGTPVGILENLLMGPDGMFVFPKSLSAKCFRREVILESQLTVPGEVLIGEDGAAFVGAVLRSRFISVIANDSGARYYCLVRVGSVSRSPDAHAFERMKALLSFCAEHLPLSKGGFAEQFDRYVVAQLYSATLLVMRSGGGPAELNAGMDDITEKNFVAAALKHAKFGRRGYKYKVKQFALRYRLWWLIRLLDKQGRKYERA